MSEKIEDNLRQEARRTIYLIIPALFIILFLTSFIFAESDGSVLTGKQSECIQLPQECADCTYVKLTTITLPDLSQISIQKDMTQNGTSFNYTFCSTEKTGSYSYCTKGDVGGTDTSACKDFDITPSGNQGNSAYIVFIIFIILIVYIITFVGIKLEVVWITVLGGMLMIFLGVYMINNGIIIYRDDLTLYFAYITSFLGAGINLWLLIEWIQDLM